MEENNILSMDVNILCEIRDDLVTYNGYRQRSLELQNDEKRFSKQLDTSKKLEASEINKTISDRKTELEKSFSQQLNETRARMKKVQDRRAKTKNTKVNKRIEEETKELREEIRINKEEIRSIFSKSGIPKIFDNNYCFSMFLPNGVGDYGIFGLTLLILFIIPLVLNWIFGIHPAVMVLIYILVLGGFGGLYYLIRKKIYLRYAQEMKDAQRYRNKITSIKRRISNKAQKIRKESDESRYELEHFDEEINDLQQQIDKIVEEKKNALTFFENQTRRDIVKEIHTRYFSEIEEDQRQLDGSRQEKNQVDAELNNMAVRISKYETYLGKEILDPTVLDSLIEIMESGNAVNVSEAIEYYKKTFDKGLQTL